MYIVIIGASDLGKYLARVLTEENHDVVVIDNDQQKCQDIANELEIVATHGDAMEQKVLEDSGVKEADAIVVLTSHDETNMVISLLAKELGAKMVAARLAKLEYDEHVLKKMGIDIVIHPEAAAAGYIAELITKPGVLDLAFISKGAAEILEIEIGEGHPAVGKKIKDIQHPSGSAIVAIVSDEELTIPDEETVIEAGQKILILAKRDVADEVRKLIG